MYDWFVFDLGNVLIKLAYERVLERICASSKCDRDTLVRIMEEPGGYRDLERGALSFLEFHDFLRDRAGYVGGFARLKQIWSDFFDGPIEGIEDVLDRVRERYKVAFLSNSNEVHEEVIPKQFGVLFRDGDIFVFSHRQAVAKPDPDIYLQMLDAIDAEAQKVIYVDDLLENVKAAQHLGMHAVQFTSAGELLRQLEGEGLL